MLVPVKLTDAERTRLKVACAEDDSTYADFIVAALDRRDADRQTAAVRAKQAHPFHVPRQ